MNEKWVVFLLKKLALNGAKNKSKNEVNFKAKTVYSFGMIMPGRSFIGSTGYRYGFNGKENDDEVKGIKGSQVDFGARVYDARIGRWLSTDPEFKKYPFLSPYVAFADNPIYFIDPEGETLKVAGDETARKQAEAYLQTLTNDKVTVNTEGLVIITSGGQNPTKDLTNGTRLIQMLSEDNKTATINITDGVNKTVIESDGNANIDKKTGGINVNGSKERPAQIGLAHELIHGLLNFTGFGIEDDENFIFEDPDYDGTEGAFDFEEYNTRMLENEIRKEQGEPERKLPTKVVDASGEKGIMHDIKKPENGPLKPSDFKPKVIIKSDTFKD